MLFDLRDTAFTVYFDGNLNTGDTYYRLVLTSKYNNQSILNSADTGDGQGFYLENGSFNERYSKFDVDFTNADLQTFDIEGYYTWTVESSMDTMGPWTAIKSGLCKVINGSTESTNNKTVEWQSDDESNSAYVFYK